MRLRFLTGEVAQGIRRNLSMFVSVVLVATVSLFFVGASLLAQREVSLAKGYWYDKVQVSIFLCTAESTDVPSCAAGAVTDAQKDAIKRQLDSMKPLVEQVFYESSDEAFTRFKQQFKNSPYLSDLTAQSMPSAYRVKLSDPNRYADVVASFDGADGVESVSDQRSVLDTFFKILGVISASAAVLAALMVLCSILLIATTIRQVAFSRRRQVGIMRHVGASASTIYLPFVIESLLAAIAGAALSIGLLWALVKFGITDHFNSGGSSGDMISLIGVDDVWQIAPWLAGIAIVLAIATAWVSLRRHLRV